MIIFLLIVYFHFQINALALPCTIKTPGFVIKKLQGEKEAEISI